MSAVPDQLPIAPPQRPLRRAYARKAITRPAAAVRAGLLPWVPVCLAAGIALFFALPRTPGPIIWAVIACLAALAALVAMRSGVWAQTGRIGWRLSDGLRLAGLAALIFAAGMALAAQRQNGVAAPVLGFRYYGPIEGRVIEIDRSARDRMRLTLDRVTLRDMSPGRTPERVRLSLMGAAADGDLPRPGQRVMLTGHLGPPPGPAAPGSFDFRAFAWFQQLGAVGYVRTPIMTVAPVQGRFWAADRARTDIAQTMRDRIGGQPGAVAAALMTGDRSGIAESTNEVMRAANLYHIISISGLHMGMLTAFVYAALRLAFVAAQACGIWAGRPIHKMAAIGALLAAAGYLWLSGGGVATERAFIMVAVMLGAILADRRAISLRTVAVAATIILILNPEALASPGFQMSFAATIALILVIQPWGRISPLLPVWLRPVLLLVVSSLIAGAATAPIAAAHFNRVPHYGLLANLLVVPVMGSLVMPAGVIAALLAPLSLAGPALWVMGLGTKWMLLIAEWITGLRGAISAVPSPPGGTIALMGFGASLAVLSWRRGRMRAPGAPLIGAAMGLTMIAAAFALWLTVTRPLLLIAPEGEAAGLMTPQGRAVSKPGGGSFVVRNWLLEDGDIADQSVSAARPGWDGPARQRQAQVPGTGWHIVHLTGKGATDAAPGHCRAQVIVIVDKPVKGAGPDWPCLLIDPASLRRTGALAVDFPDGQPRLQTVAQATGQRPWAD